MAKPTKATMLKAREDVIKALAKVQPHVPIQDPEIADAWAQIESFLAISLRVMAKTNMSKLISETKTVEISALLSGRRIFAPD